MMIPKIFKRNLEPPAIKKKAYKNGLKTDFCYAFLNKKNDHVYMIFIFRPTWIAYFTRWCSFTSVTALAWKSLQISSSKSRSSSQIVQPIRNHIEK